MSDIAVKMTDAPIVAVVEASGVELEPYGNTLLAWCPFCDQASFYVHPRINRFICFTCKRQGGPAEYATQIDERDRDAESKN